MTDYPTRADLQAQGLKLSGTYKGPFTLEQAQAILADFQGKTHRAGEPVFTGVRIVSQDEGFNVVYEDVPVPDWLPTGNPELDKLIDLYCVSSEDKESTGCKIYRGSINTASGCDAACYRLGQKMPDSFYEVEGWSDGYYRNVWVSDDLRSVLTFCEGDVIIAVCPDDDSYVAEIRHAHRFYVIQEHGRASDFDERLPKAIAAISDRLSAKEAL
jgi:hypothetical protein